MNSVVRPIGSVKGKGSTLALCHSKTSEPFRTKFLPGDYVRLGNTLAKFHDLPSRGCFPGNTRNITLNSFFFPGFFSKATGHTVHAIFTLNIPNGVFSRKDVPFGG